MLLLILRGALSCVITMATPNLWNLTGYWLRRTLMFDGDESKYELWEVKFLGYMLIRDLYDVVIPKDGEETPPM